MYQKLSSFGGAGTISRTSWPVVFQSQKCSQKHLSINVVYKEAQILPLCSLSLSYSSLELDPEEWKILHICIKVDIWDMYKGGNQAMATLNILKDLI